jgi:hypothetical protein
MINSYFPALRAAQQSYQAHFSLARQAAIALWEETPPAAAREFCLELANRLGVRVQDVVDAVHGIYRDQEGDDGREDTCRD